MAQHEELEIEIDPIGQVQVHVKGAKGKSCLNYVEIFREMLGPVTEETLTAEYYEAESRVQQGHQIHSHQRRNS